MKRILILLLFVFIQYTNSSEENPPIREWILAYQDDDVTIYHSVDIVEKEYSIPRENLKPFMEINFKISTKSNKVYKDLVAHYRNKSEEYIKFK